MKGDERLAQVAPHMRQVRLQQLEFYAFVHFTVNTFTDKEWGDGTESPDIFAPTALDAEQWVTAIKSAGMRGLILTCKHHDGFCLWQSKLTKHTVVYSPYKNGGGDVVREVADACRKHGIEFGVYLSPWDRNCPLYGQGRAYDDFFIGQLTELLTNYGRIFAVWFDGACGEGTNGRKQYYDWDRYYDVIRKLQPDATIHVCGPDVRWCGNEAGHTRSSEWSVVPLRTRDTEKISENSQHTDSDEFRQRKISAWDEDLGSREILRNEPQLIWYPAEVNTSIRPGWFWHENENDSVKPLNELIRIYNSSVGGNATFLLNIPPTSEGLFHENDVKRLNELGGYLKAAFSEDLLCCAELTADSCAEGHDITAARSQDYDGFYSPKSGSCSAVITARWEAPVDVGNIVIMENILKGQRIERFSVDAYLDGRLTEVYSGTVVGYKRIVPLGRITTDRIRIRITDSRTEPTVAFLGIFKAI